LNFENCALLGYYAVGSWTHFQGSDPWKWDWYVDPKWW